MTSFTQYIIIYVYIGFRRHKSTGSKNWRECPLPKVSKLLWSPTPESRHAPTCPDMPRHAPTCPNKCQANSIQQVLLQAWIRAWQQKQFHNGSSLGQVPNLNTGKHGTTNATSASSTTGSKFERSWNIVKVFWKISKPGCIAHENPRVNSPQSTLVNSGFSYCSLRI